MENFNQLTEQEQKFCELYANGTAPYAGNAYKCYSEIFEDDSPLARNRAKKLLTKPEIIDYLKTVSEYGKDEAENIKQYLTQNLMRIIDEASSAQYRDRRGTLLSPAPLRSVAVNASKALMDMYPVKESQNTNVTIGSADGATGITFNVIVPEANPEKDV